MTPAAVYELKLRGFFKLDVFKADGTWVRGLDWFENIITNSGLDLFYNKAYLTYCRCGTGTSTPVATQTALDAQVGSTATTLSNTSSILGTTPYYASQVVVYQFPIGSATGNIAEVGVSDTSAAVLFSRALVLDGGGLPTTITVLSDEYLQVTYQLRIYPPLADVTGSVVISGTTYSTIIRAMQCGNSSAWSVPTSGLNVNVPTYSDYSGALGAITSQPASANTVGAGGNSFGTYTAGNKYIDFTCQHNINNAATVQCGSLKGSVSCQWSISPTITMTNSNQLTWVIRIAWARGSH